MPSLVLAALLLAPSGMAHAAPKPAVRGKTQAAGVKSKRNDPSPAPSASPLSARATETIGSLSVGHPHAGFLINGVRMPEGPHWSIGLPREAYGTDETIQNLVHCIGRVNEQFPGTPRIVIGTISAERGGALPPHKSHRTGRDADVALYYIDGKWHWNQPAGPDNLDRARSWALLRAVITETDVEFVLVDRAVQALLEEYALSIGEEPAWIHEIFHGTDPNTGPLVKHVPGHTAHMHIRFVSPLARERGRLAYDQLVEQGHVQTPWREIEHTVVAGETLTGLARTYGTRVDAIRDANRLESEEIQVGQELRIKQREDIRGARDPIVVPARKVPGTTPAGATLPAAPLKPAAVRPRAARLSELKPRPLASPDR